MGDAGRLCSSRLIPYRDIVTAVWSHAVEAANPCSLLSLYVELLVEWSFFDNADELWYSALPLLHYLESACLVEEENANENDTRSENENLSSEHAFIASSSRFRMRLFLQTLSFLVAYRGSMLCQYSNSLLSLRSTLFSDPNEWLLPEKLPLEEHTKLVAALESTGVFGFIRMEDDDQCNDQDSNSFGIDWRFIPSCGKTIRRCKNFSFIDSCQFSSFCNGGPFTFITQKKNEVDGKFSPPVAELPLNHFGDDLLRHIFSFMGYKRLSRMRVVCQNWRTLVDDDFSMWMPLYKSRFGLEPEDYSLVSSKPLAWKNLFIERWTAEREIRFQRDKNGWKARLCKRIGCLTILTTPRRVDVHKSSHQRKDTVAKEREMRSRKRQQSKAASEKKTKIARLR